MKLFLFFLDIAWCYLPFAWTFDDIFVFFLPIWQFAFACSAFLSYHPILSLSTAYHENICKSGFDIMVSLSFWNIIF